MSRSFMQNRMARCGRCYAEIPKGLFCEACRSFFAQFAEWSLRSASPELPAAVRAIRQHRSRSLGNLARSSQWPQFTLVDQAISVVVRSNDPACLRQFLSGAASGNGSQYTCPEEYHYAIEARSGMGRDSRYVVWAGRQSVAVVPSRTEAIRKLRSHLQWRIAQSSTGGG